jgi:hypothetical protein
LNETLLWLLYCVSGLVAFSVTYHLRGRPIFAALAGGLLTGAGWSLLYAMTDVEQRPDWIRLDLSLNLTFGLIFAAVGAALGHWMLTRRDSPNE